jgi:hypothetical protein
MDDAVRCRKCNAPLLGSMLKPDGVFTPPKSSSDVSCPNCQLLNSAGSSNCHSCNWELPKPQSEATSGDFPCPTCQYPNLPMARKCAQCNMELHNSVVVKELVEKPKAPRAKAKPVVETPAAEAVESDKSFNPFIKRPQAAEPIPSFSMTMIQPEGEPEVATYFEGKQVELNRANLDPNNKTITSKVQAEISYVDGKWFIENRSDLGTTFIRIDEAYELKKGDVLLLGNSMFLFEG